jgi:hypothetical protein
MQVNKLIHLASEIDSEKKIYGEVNRRIQNSPEYCQTVKGVLWNRDPQIMQNNNL